MEPEREISVEPAEAVETQEAEVVTKAEETAVESEEKGRDKNIVFGREEDEGRKSVEGPSVVETAAPADAVREEDNPTAHHPLVGVFACCTVLNN